MDIIASLIILFAVLTVSLPSVESSNSTGPCPFNSLCKCVSNTYNAFTISYSPSGAYSEVTCNEVPFTKLPVIPSQNVTKLSIGGSSLEVLEENALGDMKLKSLSLANNKLIIIAPNILRNANDTLEALDLSYNSLPFIPINIINSISKLKILSLERNKIWSLRVDWNNLKNTLQSLFLGGNDISNLQLNFNFTLANFQRLISLNLDNNFLTQLEENAVPFTLVTLSADHNLISEFPLELVNNLKDLQKLNLRDNYIQQLPSYNFKLKQSLLTLDLSNNLISTLGDILGRSIKINELILSYNSISAINSKAFNSLGCVKLDLSHNKITSLSEKAFYGLSFTLEQLDLAHNSLTRFPKALVGMVKLKTVSLRRNYISSMSDSSLKNSSLSLTSLSMSHNNFRSLPKNALRNLKRLTSLTFAYNKISSISNYDFNHWADRLQSLSLSSNRLSRLDTNTFKGIAHLFNLRLPYNNIIEISDKAFSNLNFLQSLDLGYSIKNISFPEKPIKVLANLRELYLDNNNFNKLPEKGIQPFRHLSILNLDFNRIEHIPVNFFKNSHRNLLDVRFSFNKIGYIETHTFADLNSLKYITLSHNTISSIGAEAFKNLSAKVVIILSHNQLIIIGNRTFMNIPNMAELDLHNNDLKSINWHMFHNVSNSIHPMTLNLSRNRIENSAFETSGTTTEKWNIPQMISTTLYIEKCDLSHNNLIVIPYDSLRAINNSLRILDLGYNYIKTLHNNPFKTLSNLEILNLEHNAINDIEGSRFEQLQKLQILDMSHNHITTIYSDQFNNLGELRVLDLSNNFLSSLPSECFKNTKIERLILSGNQFVTVPSQSIFSIGHTLGVLDLSHNKIQNMDADQFTSTPLITDLNLCYNNINQILSSTFRNLNSLVNLQLCSNKLTTRLDNFGHNISLHYLNLADIALNHIPFIDQVNLIHLNISGNNISVMTEGFLFGMPNLRTLDLSRNNLRTMINPRWNEAEHLNELDLSSNPIEVLTEESFRYLNNLKSLNLQNLYKLKRFDADSLSACTLLYSLKIQTWPTIEKYRFRLPTVISSLKKLQRLSVKIVEEKLTDQLADAFPPKLTYLEISGEKLKEVNIDALKGLRPTKDMTIRFTGTNITEFPKGFFTSFRNIKASIDLRGNTLAKVGPEIFYTTPPTLQLHGTQAFSGGIHLHNNNLECGCEASWMGQWLRRFMRETLTIHTKNVKYGRDIIEDFLEVKCQNSVTGERIELLTYVHEGCYVGGSTVLKINFLLVISMVIMNISRYI